MALRVLYFVLQGLSVLAVSWMEAVSVEGSASDDTVMVGLLMTELCTVAGTEVEIIPQSKELAVVLWLELTLVVSQWGVAFEWMVTMLSFASSL